MNRVGDIDYVRPNNGRPVHKSLLPHKVEPSFEKLFSRIKDKTQIVVQRLTMCKALNLISGTASLPTPSTVKDVLMALVSVAPY